MKKNTLMFLDAKVDGRSVWMLVDSGATHDFASARLLRAFGLASRDEGGTLRVQFGDTSVATQKRRSVRVELQLTPDYRLARSFLVLEQLRYDLVLGRAWLSDVNPRIDWKRGTLSFRVGDREIFLQARSGVSKALPTVDVREVRREDTVWTGWLPTTSGEEWGEMCEITEGVDEDSQDGRSKRLEVGEGIEGLHDLMTRFSDVFPDKLPEVLPPERGHTHAVDLLPGARPPRPRSYKPTHAEEEELITRVRDLEQRGFLRKSTSEFGAPVFFVKKPGGGLRLVCDWRGLNEITVKETNEIPVIEQLMNRLSHAKVFTQLDLESGYHQMRIRAGDEHKTAISTPLGRFEWTVLGFGLCNGPTSFQRMMKDVLRDLPFVIVYLDDIRIFFRSAQEHLEHLELVLTRLREARLYCKPSKCRVGVRRVLFVGHVVEEGSVSTNPAKIEAVVKMARPRTLKEARTFLGMASYFRRHIRNFAQLAEPIVELTRGKRAFVWRPEQQAAFETIKTCLVSAPVLALPDFDLPFVVMTDASDVACGAVLCQEKKKGERVVIAYRSRLWSQVERNWPVHEREAFAIVDALTHWRHYLDSTKEFDVETDHKSLLYLQTQKEISKKQARWLEKLASFNFKAKYIPGESQVIADALSRPAG